MGNQSEQIDYIEDARAKNCCQNLSLKITSKNTEASEVTCMICFTLYKSPKILKCKHIFCEGCIKEWGKGNTASCPYCRIELKKHKGSFGRADKRTQKKLEKLYLKCRNCCWTGSYLQFTSQFSCKPYLDDEELPTQINQVKPIQEEQGQTIGFQIDDTKNQLLEKEKQELKVQEQKCQEQQVIARPHTFEQNFDKFVLSIFNLNSQINLDEVNQRSGFYGVSKNYLG